MSQNKSCEMCGSSDKFRFDGQHMVCECGTVLIREVESDQKRKEGLRKEFEQTQREKKVKRDHERWLKSLQGHYEIMNGFDSSFRDKTPNKFRYSHKWAEKSIEDTIVAEAVKNMMEEEARISRRQNELIKDVKWS